MRTKISKLLSLSNNIISPIDINQEKTALTTVGKQLHKAIGKKFSGSLAIRQVDAGSDNSCEQELVALTNPFYDIGRFGIHFVASPRHADMLLVTGPVTRNMQSALLDAYNAMPTPRLVVAIGDDAIDGGIYRDSYAVVGGVSAVIPVDYQIAGDPPTPMQIIQALLNIIQSDSINTPKSNKKDES